MAEVEDRRRRTFGPVVAVGLAAAGLSAYAGHQEMLRVPDDALDAATPAVGVTHVEFPLAGALALVVLAGWGALLVTRGAVRRAVAALATLAALGAFVVVAVGGFVQRDDAAADLAARLGSPLGQDLPVDPTGWFWATLAGTLLAVVAGALATVLAPSWPEMGSRYDAPTTHAPDGPAEERTSLDLWKSMDEGDDPTST